MSEPNEYREPAIRARIMSAALGLGRSIDLWSLTLLSIALLVLLLTSLPALSDVCLIISILAGATQKFFALRVAFDEPIFSHWAATWQSAANQDQISKPLTSDLVAFDQALEQCGLRKPGNPLTRNLNSRISGATTLIKRQLLAFSIQLLALVATILPLYWL